MLQFASAALVLAIAPGSMPGRNPTRASRCTSATQPKLVPGLATSQRAIDDLTWEFKVFHVVAGIGACATIDASMLAFAIRRLGQSLFMLVLMSFLVLERARPTAALGLATRFRRHWHRLPGAISIRAARKPSIDAVPRFPG